MKICGLASGECGISISWLGTRLAGLKASRFHTDRSSNSRVRYLARPPSDRQRSRIENDNDNEHDLRADRPH
jgi:hypothetical protein